MNPLIATIISGIVESIVGAPSPPVQPPPYTTSALVRPKQQNSPLAVMGSPANGYARFDDKVLRLAANLQIRDTQNRIVVPLTIERPVPVLYKLDEYGSVMRVWVLTPEETAVAETIVKQRASAAQQ
jgi:hypothetical protein